MTVVFVGLRKIPNRALRLIVAAATQDASASVLIQILIGPLPDIPHEIHHAKRACSVRMLIYIVGISHRTALILDRHGACVPCITPRISSAISALCGELPLPFMWQTLSR